MNNKQHRKDAIHRVFNIARAIITAITICIALAYTGLSAQSKGFNDTVILRNGKILSGVKAVVTKDSLVVTTSEGETSVFTKKEVSEVKKGGAAKTNSTPSSETWSAYQGKMNWEDAKEKCASIGMRLPTIGELKAAYTAGTTESWKIDGINYWSYTPVADDNAYNLFISDGKIYDADSIQRRIGKLAVRCLR